MSGLNKCMIIGHLGRDPESRVTTTGTVCNFSVATSESWTDKASGERKEKTEWHRIVIFNERVADVAVKYLHKGSKVYIEGALQSREWTDQSGAKKVTTEIVISRFKGELVLLDKKEQGVSDHVPPAQRPATSSSNELDDEIPF